MPVVASPIAMLVLPPISEQTTVPSTAWSWPSIVTVLLPSAAAADDVSPVVSDFSSPDEQPDRPAMTIAAPPTATTIPRFTKVSFSRVVRRTGEPSPAVWFADFARICGFLKKI